MTGATHSDYSVIIYLAAPRAVCNKSVSNNLLSDLDLLIA